jgi:hypothetical protein
MPCLCFALRFSANDTRGISLDPCCTQSRRCKIKGVMVKTVQKFDSLEAMKDEEYRYWQSVPASARIEAIYDHSVEMYRMKGIIADGQGLKRTLVRFERPSR